MLKKIQIIGAIYFLSYIGSLFMNWIIVLDLNPLLTSVLAFIECIFDIPQDSIDLIIMYFGLDRYLIPMSFILFCLSAYDLIWGDGLEF